MIRDFKELIREYAKEHPEFKGLLLKEVFIQLFHREFRVALALFKDYWTI